MGESEREPVILNNVGETMHDLLHTVCRYLPTDFEPYGKRERNAFDCSCGCKHFLKLPDKLGYDWGVCINPRSPRSGLLTFEHQGCEFFEAEENDQELKDLIAELKQRDPSKITAEYRREADTENAAGV